MDKVFDLGVSSYLALGWLNCLKNNHILIKSIISIVYINKLKLVY